MSKTKGLPRDPAQAEHAKYLLAQLRHLTEAQDWKRAAPISYELTRIAPELTEAYDLMGRVAFQTTAFDIAENCFERAVKLGPVNGHRLHAWATALIAQGDLLAAETILVRALVFRPNDPLICTDLADTYLAQNRHDEAEKLYRLVLKTAPDNTYARHMVSALSASRTPDLAYVTNLFNTYAPIFDQHLTGALHYRIPEIVAEELKAYGEAFPQVLDLGCGTGLFAQALNGRYTHIDGVDLAAKMVEKARERKLYRHLFVGDCQSVLESQPSLAGPYNLITALDMLIYFGTFESLFAAIATRLAPGGIFVFTTEHAETDEIELRASGRFAHSQTYVQNTAHAAGLKTLALQSHTIRLEQQRPIAGDLYILARS